jgi:hypothetical protein
MAGIDCYASLVLTGLYFRPQPSLEQNRLRADVAIGSFAFAAFHGLGNPPLHQPWLVLVSYASVVHTGLYFGALPGLKQIRMRGDVAIDSFALAALEVTL